MENWIYLQLLLGYGCINARKVIENIKGITKLPEMSDNELLGLGVTKSQLKARNPKLREQALTVYKQCRENYITVIPYSDARFPKKLKQIHNPPIVIYTAGGIPDFDNRLSVAVIGTRKISELGGSAAFSLSLLVAILMLTAAQFPLQRLPLTLRVEVCSAVTLKRINGFAEILSGAVACF